MRFGGALLAVCFASLAAEAATYVRLQSQPGDPTGAGEQRVEYSDLKAYSMTVTPNSAGGVDFLRALPCPSICAPSADYTSIQFAPAAGQSFTAGTYSPVQKATRSAGSRPGLLVDERARDVDRCTTVTGSFVVHEIARNADGTVARFAADFEQHCNGQAPAVYGAVRFNSDVPYQQPVPYAPAAVRFASEPGDPIGMGETGAFVVLDGQSSSINSAPNSVHLLLRDAAGVSRWSFDLATGSTDPFQPNITYPNVGIPGMSAGGPTLEVRHNGQAACASYANASFHVFESQWSPEGLLLRFAADVKITCTGATGAFNAGVRYNSTVPYLSPTKLDAAGNLPNGGELALSFDASAASCTLQTVSVTHQDVAPLPVPAPRFVAYPYGLMTFSAEGCGGQVTFHVDVEQDLPSTAQWWQFGPTFDNSAGHWYVLRSQVNGKRLSFTINDAELGDSNVFTRDGKFQVTGLIAIPGGVTQDLWWSGPAENGWGMSIIQHADKLFANVYVYDAQGKPVWYVMPAGAWNVAHTAFTGAVFLPKGSPFYAYDGSRFNIGAAVGTMTLTFANTNAATFDYTINGITGRKDISRVLFGPVDAPTDQPHADLWWAGAQQNGWGIAVLQQYTTLFALWFTYDASGNATWFVMPGGSWAAKDDYRGDIFRAAGPAWLGVPYDVSRHSLTDVGNFALRFSGGDAATFDYSVDGRAGSIPLSRIPF